MALITSDRAPAVTYTGERAAPPEGAMKPRVWRSIEAAGYFGRFVPDTEAKSDDELFGMQNEGMSYEEWLRHCTTQVIETEINIQLGEFTLKKRQTKQLNFEISDHPDFITVFGNIAQENPVQCAEVLTTADRSWVRLVGRRHDCMHWTEDQRTPVHANDREYPKMLKDSETWIQDILEHDGFRNKNLNNYDLLLPSAQKDSNIAVLCAYVKNEDPNVKAKKNKDRSNTLREIVVVKDPPVVHIYNVVEHGRRFFRTLIFSSDADVCMHAMEPSPVFKMDIPAFISGSADVVRTNSSHKRAFAARVLVASDLCTTVCLAAEQARSCVGVAGVDTDRVGGDHSEPDQGPRHAVVHPRPLPAGPAPVLADGRVHFLAE